MVSRVSKNRDQGGLVSRLETGRILLVDHGGAGIDRPQRIGINRREQLVPVDQVLADGVTPGHISPDDMKRVVLEEQMPLAAVVDHSVRIIIPALPRREVELGTILLVIEVRRFQENRRLGGSYPSPSNRPVDDPRTPSESCPQTDPRRPTRSRAGSLSARGT